MKTIDKNSKKYLFFISQDYSFPVLRPLQKAILERGDEVKWFMYGSEIDKKNLKENEKELKLIDEVVAYKPDAVFVPGNVVPSFISGLKVEVFHGLPSTKAKKNGELYHFIIRGMFDLYCTQGNSSTKPFKDLAKKYGYFHVEETGWCKLDPLFPIESKSQKGKTILFASTFSPRFSKARVLYPLLLEMMKKYDFKWYITLHPKMDKEIVALYKNINMDNVKFVESVNLVGAFKDADMMLCDTSSIIYEFLTQKKPVVTFQTQKEEPSLINVTDIDKLEREILNTLEHLDINKKNIEQHIKEFHPYTDGKSSKRVLDAVEKMLDKEYIPLKEKPLNLIRNFKLRKELGYWRF
jgi:hypothetical protein